MSERAELKNLDTMKKSVEERPTNHVAAEALYQQALPATRSGPLFGAFPYPTKISPETIALYIAAHTKPGDTVFDGFAGSGTTGIAALLCGKPTDKLCEQANRLGLDVEWGPRNAILYELSALGSFIGRTLTNPPHPDDFVDVAKSLLADAEDELGWMYQANGPDGDEGAIRYTVWSDFVNCAHCDLEISLWDASVTREPARVADSFDCPSCSQNNVLAEAKRSTETVYDELLGKSVEQRKRRPVWIYGQKGSAYWSRRPTDEDLSKLREIGDLKIPAEVPVCEIPWGDLYRRGYHTGISHLHHFYTRRNLIVFAHLWKKSAIAPPKLRDALRFWLLSYNASHSTIMTRVVAKTGQKDLVVTSAQPGVLYVSGLPVEKNLFSGLRRKLSTITRAFEAISETTGTVEVQNRSSCHVELPDCSIDYAFTDPPFGGNIPYAEINFLNEAWLGEITDRSDEAIISGDQGKGIAEYQELVASALSEVQRILKPDGRLTVVFHSASAKVWNALQSAYSVAGFAVECAGVLDKTQGSFKQVTTTGAVKGDPVLLLHKKDRPEGEMDADVWRVAETLYQNAESGEDASEQTVQRLYSRLVSHYLSRHMPIPIDAESFYEWHKQRLSAGKREIANG